MIKDYCTQVDNKSDLFVGVKFIGGKPSVYFPRGYNVSSDEKECRKDIFRLLSVLNRYPNNKKDGTNAEENQEIITRFPLKSYQYIIQDFLLHGYYVEKETHFVAGIRGKINWKRTIQKEQVQIDNSNPVYLKFQVKTNKVNENNLMTEIHKYCVYKSFFLFGWLFLSSEYLPQKPSIRFDKILFLNTLRNALKNTFNDKKKQLFQSMINIIEFEGKMTIDENATIGVDSFEGVWEWLVDFVFGEENKDKYFPHGQWQIISKGCIETSSALEPDTIMKHNGKIYILDAKYYYYGVSYYPGDLPTTSSIQKQITYGKRIDEMKETESPNDIYNAFIMPYKANGNEKWKLVSVGTVDWEEYTDDTWNYKYVLGLLVDTKYLINTYVRHNDTEIEALADMIEAALEEYKKIIIKGK